MTGPAPLLSTIRARPDDEAGWLALAAHDRDNGRDDEAAALRVFWPAVAECMATGRPLEVALKLLRRNAAALARRARGIEERGANESPEHP